MDEEEIVLGAQRLAAIVKIAAWLAVAAVGAACVWIWRRPA
jgi:hypothetical protein